MKKNIKRLMALVVAMVMAIAMMSVSAFAADTTTDTPATYKLTLNNTTAGHTYEVYQIFTGDISGTDTKTLSNVKYGTNYVPTGKKVGDLVPKEDLEAITNADTFASSVTTTGTAVKTVTSSATSTVIEGLAPGYYLVKETTTSVPDGESMTKNILQVVGDTTVNIKSGTTSSEKKVKDVNDSQASSTTNPTGWQDSADYDIGDDVPFQLKATVASDYANYTKGYTLTFHDKESAGLQFNSSSVKVYVDGSEITTGFEVITDTTKLESGETFQVKFANLKDITSVHAGSVITVEYTAKLTGDAVVIGSTGNPNESHITYTNNPNDDQHGDNGKTPDDKVIVFTYKLTADKVDEDNKALTGAGFTLYKKNASGEYVAVGTEVKGEALTTFSWNGVDDGDYKLVETTTPPGYNTMKDLTFTISATHDTNSADPKLTDLGCTNLSDEAQTFTGNVGTGEIKTDIENKKGSTLPSTGGIGTTIFYVLGAILVAGAAIVLVARKRSQAE